MGMIDSMHNWWACRANPPSRRAGGQLGYLSLPVLLWQRGCADREAFVFLNPLHAKALLSMTMGSCNYSRFQSSLRHLGPASCVAPTMQRLSAAQYAGLWHEAEAQPAAAEQALVVAVRTAYGQRSGDYMAAVARMHCQQRGWRT